jgi:hypothetical protein
MLSPPVYWRVVGTLRGEAFWNGRPTSYYRAGIYAWGDFCIATSNGRTDGRTWQWTSAEMRRAEWTFRWEEWVRRHLGNPVANAVWPPPESPFKGIDSGAVPVLVELTGDPDESVQIAALAELRRLHHQASAALPAVRARAAACRLDTPMRGHLLMTAEWIDEAAQAALRRARMTKGR